MEECCDHNALFHHSFSLAAWLRIQFTYRTIHTEILSVHLTLSVRFCTPSLSYNWINEHCGFVPCKTNDQQDWRGHLMNSATLACMYMCTCIVTARMTLNANAQTHKQGCVNMYAHAHCTRARTHTADTGWSCECDK